MKESQTLIGGDFAIDFDEKILTNINNQYNSIYNKKYHYFTDCGRSAISIALQILKKKNQKLKALLPVYCCPTIIKTFKKNNIKLSFYSMGKNLNSPNSLPKNTNNTIIFFIHYFGKKNNLMINYINKQKKISKNCYIIEDLVQTCFSHLYNKYVGDFIITSLRKFLPVPDGGILYTNYKYEGIIQPKNDTFLSKIILSKTLRKKNKYEKIYLKFYKQSEKILNNENNIRAMSSISRKLLANLNIKYIQNQRIKNWKILEKYLINKNLKQLYSTIQKNEVPLAYPLLINPNKRKKFDNYLKKNKIYCAIHWNLGYIKTNKRFYEDYKISKSIISIPIDHRLNKYRLNKLIRTINDF